MDRPRLETDQGTLRGRRIGGLAGFLGVPYAAAPVGPLRWAPPAPPDAWDGERDAGEYGPIAPQVPSPFDELLFPGPAQAQAEACLSLNAWTPATDDARRPVLVWVHGGGFTIGAGSQPLYDGRYLARVGDMVVVTVNYRLGALGFLRLAGITGGAIPASGNEALLDLVAALRWVRDHAARLGGDPGNITLCGESAGAMLAATLLAMPVAAGLFRRAILQSGAGHAVLDRNAADRAAQRLVEIAGVPDADPDALRALPPARLLAAQQALLAEAPRHGLGFLPFRPVVDGLLLPLAPYAAVAAGSAAAVQLMVGTTADEWTLFAGLDPSRSVLDEAGLRRRLGHRFTPAQVDGFLARYPQRLAARGIEADPGELLTAILGDAWFRVPAERLLAAQARHRADARAYLFAWQARPRRLRACHSVELGFLFGHLDSGFHGHGPAAEKLVAEVQLAWSGFARDGCPSVASLGDWPAWTRDGGELMRLGPAACVARGEWADVASAWSGIDDASLSRY